MTHSTATYHLERNEKTSTHHHLPRRRRPAVPSGTAATEEKPLPEYLSLLPSSDCREAGAIAMPGGNQMKKYSISLTSEEQKMLEQVISRLRLSSIELFVKHSIRQRWLSPH